MARSLPSPRHLIEDASWTRLANSFIVAAFVCLIVIIVANFFLRSLLDGLPMLVQAAGLTFFSLFGLAAARSMFYAGLKR
jgi:uncharacterized membrane protein YeiH